MTEPGYPASLVDEACSIGDLGTGSRVLEIGCATGKLTGALAERGLDVRTTSAYLRLDAERRGVLERSVADPIEAHGGTDRSMHFATLVTARAARPRT